MTFQVRVRATGAVVPISDSQYAAYVNDTTGRYEILSAPQQATAGGGATVDPTVPYQQWLANYYLNLADTQSTRMNAQTNQFNAGTNQLGTLGSLYASMRGDPANWANYANLLRGRTKADYPAFVGALSGLTSGLSDQSIDTRQLGVSNFDTANFGVIGMGGGGGAGSMQTAAEQAGSASQIGGTDAFGNPVNLFARQNGSRDLNGIGYEQSGPGAIGNPRRNLESLGLDPIGPNGEWLGPTWDANGSPVYPPGYDGPRWPRMPTNATEEAQWNDWVRNNMPPDAMPAYDTGAQAQVTAAAPGMAYEGTKAKAAAAQAVGSNRYKATDQAARVAAEAARDAQPADRVAREAAARAGESAADRQYREYFESTAHGQAALQAGKVIANQQTGGGFAGQPTTVYTFGDGSQTEYRNIDGATVSHGTPWTGTPAPAAGDPRIPSVTTAPPKAGGGGGQSDSGNTSTKPAAPKTVSKPTPAPTSSSAPPKVTTSAGTKPSSGLPSMFSSLVRRAGGGADLATGPIDFAQMAMDARAAPPMDGTTPGVSIVTQPTMIDRPGPADILTGEPQPEFPGAEDGGDEVVLVIPLENPDIGVDQWVADLANEQAGEQRYAARPGPKPAWLQSITAGVTGQPSMLMPPPVEGAEPLLDPLAKPPMPPMLGMAHGGATVSVGKTAIRPISSRAVTLNPANKPFALSDAEKKAGLYPNGRYVSDSGNVQAPSSKDPGKFITIPQFQAIPVPDPLSMPARAARAVLKSPLEMALLDSILKARGRGDGESFWSVYYGNQRTQRSPMALGTRRMF